MRIRRSPFNRALLLASVFCAVTLIAAFFYSVIGINGEIDQDTFANNQSTSTISLRITKNGTDVTSLDLNLSPSPTGSLIKDDLNLLVATDNATGYQLDFSNADDNTALTHTTSTISETIPSITTTTNQSSFPVNSWGYSLDPISAQDQSFSPIPTKSTPTTIKTTTTPTTSLPNGVDQTDITFAIKADTNLPSGTYKDTVVFSVVANYIPNALEQISTMQDMTPQVCKQASIGDTATLKDVRDSKTYVVKKLADGKCWMVQNLRLGGSSAITLTPADSNVTANFTLSATTNSFGTTNDAAGININRMHDNGNTWLNGSSVQTSGTPPSQTQYMGNYYNWYTATAGSGTYSTGSNVIATQSICPKGWRLPKGGAINATTGNGEFQQLYDAYGNATNFISNTSAVLSGFWYDSSANDQGSRGGWWSSTAYDSALGYYLIFNSSSVYPQSNHYKRDGLSVRCVAEGDLTTISTMQEMTTSICTNSAIGDSKALRDTRDNKTYTVKKLADGKCWMTQNLRLVGSRTLTPADSNVTANFSLPASNTSFGTTDDPAGINIARVNDTGRADYGAYYNWYTATASTGTYSMSSGNATSSVCPKGWRLPTGGANGEFQALYSAYNSNVSNFISATSAVLSGSWFESSAYYQGSNGYWWSSTAYDLTGGYYLSFSSSNIGPQSYYFKRSGFSVRCVAEGPLDGITTMQEMTTAICSAATIGDEKILRDTRDNKTYTVKKLADGRCWMTQNLRLVGPLTLTPADSNVTANFSLPASSTSFGTTNDDIARVNNTGVITSYGAHYNWYAATASSGTYSTGAGVSVSQSVCPKGWRLPTGGASGEFQALYSAYNSNASNFISVTSAVLSGGWSNSSANNQGYYGFWWSSTAYDSTSGYNLRFDSSNVYPQSNNFKRSGYSVRCVAE